GGRAGPPGRPDERAETLRGGVDAAGMARVRCGASAGEAPPGANDGGRSPRAPRAGVPAARPVVRLLRRGAWSAGSGCAAPPVRDRKSTRLNSRHVKISYAVFCLKKKKIL